MVLLGIAWIAFPEASLRSWGVRVDPGAVYLGRRYGTLFLGYAMILWLARGLDSTAARRVILLGNAVVNAAMTLASVAGAVSAVVTPAAWGAACVEGLLAAAFAYFYVKAR
jgi:hypothetical protein